MSLQKFSYVQSIITDLSPLQGMPLTELSLGGEVFDLTPLEGLGLTEVFIHFRKFTKGIDVLRRMKSIQTIGYFEKQKRVTPSEFWKQYDARNFDKPITNINDPAFIQWTKDVATLPAEKQVDAVAKKLVELNPGFDGVVIPELDGNGPRGIQNGVVTELRFLTNNVTDISPVRALVGLKALRCSGKPHAVLDRKLSNLSPLRGMALAVLDCSDTLVSDLSPLQGMPLRELNCGVTEIDDLSPLQGMRLKKLACNDTGVRDLSSLKGMELTSLTCHRTLVSDLSPLQGMPLTGLYCGVTQVSDLSPLQGMPLDYLQCFGTKVTDLSPLQGIPLKLVDSRFTKVSDLSPLEGCVGLKNLPINGTKVTPAQVAAFQKAVPNCKIEWDEPAKPKTP
jgi:hypothetical protein